MAWDWSGHPSGGRSALRSPPAAATAASSVHPTPAPIAAAPVDAAAFVQGLARDLTAGELELPGFPDVVMRLHRTLGDEKSSVKDIGQLIRSEPALAARLVQLANSAAFNSSGREISDLRAAITHLGFNVVRSQATTFAMRQMEQMQWLKPIGAQLAEIWKTSNHVAAICSAVGKRVDGVQADEALATGLFHLLGKLYIFTRALRDGVDAHTIAEWESAINDWHPTIARAILDHWSIPSRIAEAVESQNALFDTEAGDLPLLPRILAAAKLCYRMKGPPDAQTAERQAILDKVRIGREAFMDVVARWQLEIEATRHAMG
jgi:HD-like signal output (HDOD) protein